MNTYLKKFLTKRIPSIRWEDRGQEGSIIKQCVSNLMSKEQAQMELERIKSELMYLALQFSIQESRQAEYKGQYRIICNEGGLIYNKEKMQLIVDFLNSVYGDIDLSNLNLDQGKWFLHDCKVVMIGESTNYCFSVTPILTIEAGRVASHAQGHGQNTSSHPCKESVFTLAKDGVKSYSSRFGATYWWEDDSILMLAEIYNRHQNNIYAEMPRQLASCILSNTNLPVELQQKIGSYCTLHEAGFFAITSKAAAIRAREVKLSCEEQNVSSIITTL